MNPVGNPHGRPVTLSWKDTALKEVLDTDLFPWLFLHHKNGKLKEIDDGNNGPGFVLDSNASDNHVELSEANGFISLAVDQSITITVDFKFTEDGLQL